MYVMLCYVMLCKVCLLKVCRYVIHCVSLFHPSFVCMHKPFKRSVEAKVSLLSVKIWMCNMTCLIKILISSGLEVSVHCVV